MREAKSQSTLIMLIAALVTAWITAIIVTGIIYNHTDSSMAHSILVVIMSIVTLKYLNTLSALRMRLFDLRHREDRRA